MAKKFGKKLVIRMSTIAQLNGAVMNGVVGGKHGCTIEDSGCTQDSMRGEATCTQFSVPCATVLNSWCPALCGGGTNCGDCGVSSTPMP
jgi:hypothetical protein